jgi:uncharacterized protein YgiM (DUF1202 family)
MKKNVLLSMGMGVLVAASLVFSTCATKEALMPAIEPEPARPAKSATLPPIQDPQEAQATPPAATNFAQLYYVTQNANLRRGPSTSDGIIVVLSAGTEIELISSTQNNGFYHVWIEPRGIEGYLHNSLISQNRSSPKNESVKVYSPDEYTQIVRANELRSKDKEFYVRGRIVRIEESMLGVSYQLFLKNLMISLTWFVDLARQMLVK